MLLCSAVPVKIVNVVGDEVHTLVVSRINPQLLSESEQALLKETEAFDQTIVITTLVAGPYAGSQWTRLEDVCVEELQTIHNFLLTEEGWDSVKSGDRIGLDGAKLKTE